MRRAHEVPDYSTVNEHHRMAGIQPALRRAPGAPPAPEQSLGISHGQADSVALMIGPEGGLSATKLPKLKNLAFPPRLLSAARVLPTETAAGCRHGTLLHSGLWGALGA